MTTQKTSIYRASEFDLSNITECGGAFTSPGQKKKETPFCLDQFCEDRDTAAENGDCWVSYSLMLIYTDKLVERAWQLIEDVKMIP